MKSLLADILAMIVGFPIFIIVYLFWHGAPAFAFLLGAVGIIKKDNQPPFSYAPMKGK